MERDPRPDRETDSGPERPRVADGLSGRFADVYGAEREDLRHQQERLEFLSCDPFERAPGKDEPAR
ncbi:MAG: hypothetical protein EXS08_14245 [Planctomycetes bacterium]|nr:hypothetical protein [Planctomycetota bacterium]